MSKMKKVLLMCTAYVLVAALAIGGTVAYLQDDDSDVNVMTLGNVSIEQHEYERVVDANGDYVVDSSVGGYKLQPFTQAKPLYPATIPTSSAEWTYESTNAMFEQVGANGGGMNVFVEPNAVDKFVFVENTGKTDAYVRTLIAFESGSLSAEEWSEVVSTSYHFSWGAPVVIGSITVENNNYVVLEYTYQGRPDQGFHENGILPAGEVTQCSLGQVYMRSTATNEDCEAIDGNKNGTYDILVVSQAVQTAGFADAKTALDVAFGESTAENAAVWFGGVVIPVTVATADELVEALENGKSVVLTDDVKIDPAGMSNAYGTTGINVKNGQTIEGNGNTLDIKGAGGTWDSGICTSGGLIKNLTVTGSFRGIFIKKDANHNERVVLENVIIDGTTYTISVDSGTGKGLTATNSTFNGWTSYAATLGEAEFIDCSFGEGAGYAFCRPYAPTTFVGCEFEAGYRIDPRAKVTFENCTIGGAPLTADNLATLVTYNIQNASVK